jgi:hypothetical protein
VDIELLALIVLDNQMGAQRRLACRGLTGMDIDFLQHTRDTYQIGFGWLPRHTG